MHLRIWCILRVESMVLVPADVALSQRTAEGLRVRQLGAKVGTNLQCAHDSVLYGPA